MAKDLLKDITIRNAKPTDKDQRLTDGAACIYLSSPMAQNGGVLITLLVAAAKPYPLAFILRLA